MNNAYRFFAVSCHQSFHHRGPPLDSRLITSALMPPLSIASGILPGSPRCDGVHQSPGKYDTVSQEGLIRKLRL
jgi:hypothetical protein